MNDAILYSNLRLQQTIGPYLKGCQTLDVPLSKQQEKLLDSKVHCQITAILKWGQQLSRTFGEIFRFAAKPCHSPLYLINYIRLYIEERLELILQITQDSTDSSISDLYDKYMVALAKIYYSIETEKLDDNKKICLNFIRVIDEKIEKLALEDKGLNIPASVCPFIEQALSELHRLDLSVSQIINGSLGTCSKAGKICSKLDTFEIGYDDFIEICQAIIKHSGASLDWLVSYITRLVDTLPRDIRIIDNGFAPFCFASGREGIQLLRKARTLIRCLENELANPKLDFTKAQKLSEDLFIELSGVADIFRYNRGAPEEYKNTVSKLEARYLKCPQEQTKMELQQAQDAYVLTDAFLLMHILISTHHGVLNDNLTALFRAWSVKEKKNPGWTLMATAASLSKRQTAISNTKQVKALINLEKSQTLLQQCADGAAKLEHFTQILQANSNSVPYYNEVNAALHHTWLYVQHLAASIETLQSRAPDSPESQLSIASSLVENSYLILEQMGIARMGLLNFEPLTSHGLFPLYPKAVRQGLNAITLINDLNNANSWVRYPQQTFHQLCRGSTLGEPKVPPVFGVLLASAKQTQVKQTKVFAIHAVGIAERTLAVLHPLIELLGHIAHVSMKNLDPVSPQDTNLQAPIDKELLAPIMRDWSSAVDIHRDVWKDNPNLPTITGLRYQDQHYYLRAIVGELKRLQGQTSSFELAQISCHLSEYTYLLFTSSLQAIIEERSGNGVASYLTTEQLLQKCGLNDACLNPKKRGAVYSCDTFVDSMKQHLNKVNSVSRYPFKMTRIQSLWHEVALAAVKASNLRLTDSAFSGKSELSSIRYEEEVIKAQLVARLKEGANLFRYGILPVMQNRITSAV